MIEQTLDITTRDGRMETFVRGPERGGPFAAVFFPMDAPADGGGVARFMQRIGCRG